MRVDEKYTDFANFFPIFGILVYTRAAKESGLKISHTSYRIVFSVFFPSPMRLFSFYYESITVVQYLFVVAFQQLLVIRELVNYLTFVICYFE